MSVITKYNQNHINDIIDYVNNNFKGIDFISFCNLEVNINNNEDYQKKSRFFPNLEIIKNEISKIKYKNVKIDNLPLCIFGDNLDIAEKNSMNFSEYKFKIDKCSKCNLSNKCGGIFPYFENNFNLIKPYE